MGKHRNIKRLEARKKRRREKGNRDSLAVSAQRTDPKLHLLWQILRWRFAFRECTTDPELHPLSQNLRWRFAFRELIANLWKWGSLNVSHRRTNSEPAKKWNFAFYTILTRNLGFKRGKTEGARHSSLLGHIGELCAVLGHGFWWRSSWRLKFERDFGFTLRFFFSIFLPSILFNVYD